MCFFWILLKEFLHVFEEGLLGLGSHKFGHEKSIKGHKLLFLELGVVLSVLAGPNGKELVVRGFFQGAAVVFGRGKA